MIDALGHPQSALLVGGTSQIGLAIVRRLAAGGRLERVVLAGRPGPGLDAATQALADELPGCVIHQVVTDMTDSAAAAAAIDEVLTGTPIDVVVLAAGVLADQTRAETDPQVIADAFLVNTVGPVAIGTAVLEAFRRQGRGVLVVLSSVATQRMRPDNYAYGASKAGLDAWARGAGDALRGTPVRLLLVRPGMVRTRMSDGLPEAPLTCDPEDVAAAVADHLTTGPTVIWVPRGLRAVAIGLRLAPRRVLERLATQRETGPETSAGIND